MSVHQCLDAGCSCSCTIATDTFDGDLSNFAQTGTPTVGGGLLTLDASDGVIHNTSAISADSGVHLEVDPDTNDATATLRLKVAWSDADNYLFGEWAKAAGAATIRLGQRVAATETWLTSAVTVEDTAGELDARSTMELCWEPGAAIAGAADEALRYAEVIDQASTADVEWQNPDNMRFDDGSQSQATFTLDGQVTRAITAHGFGFAVPAGSTIDGIRVRIECADQDAAPSEIFVDTIQLVDGTGTPVGDDKGGAAIPAASLDGAIFGSSTDDWNAGLDWEDINDGNFGIVFQFRWDDGATTGTRTAIIEFINIYIWYTTPNRERGRLVFSYHNTGSSNKDCVREFAAFSPAGGLKAGVSSSAGTFTIGTFTYSYLYDAANFPTCPDCDCTVAAGEPCACCNSPPAAQNYTVDLGAGGWSDNNCDACEQVAGEYLLEPFVSCGWIYSDPSLGTCDNPFFGEPDLDGELTLLLSLEEVSGGGCKWVLIVSYGLDFPSLSMNPSIARYESATIANNECQTAIELNLVLTQHTGNWCIGTLPDPINLSVA